MSEYENDWDETLGQWGDLLSTIPKLAEAGYNIYEGKAKEEEDKKRKTLAENKAKQEATSAEARQKKHDAFLKEVESQKANPVLQKAADIATQRLTTVKQEKQDYETKVKKANETFFSKHKIPILIAGGVGVVAIGYLAIRR